MVQYSERYSDWKYSREKRTLGYVLEDKAQRVPDRNFIRFKEGPWVTFADMDQRVNRIANGLRTLGIEKGDKVGIMTNNCLEFIYVWFALAKLGGIEVPINVHYKGEWLRHTITNSDLKMVVIGDEYIERLKVIEEALNTKMKIIAFPGQAIEGIQRELSSFEFHPFEVLTDNPSDPPNIHVNYYDPIAIMYTSGTTGVSKGAVCSHSFYYTWAEVCATVVRTTSDDTYYVWSPLFHQTAQAINTFSAMVHEAKVVLTDRFSASNFWDELRASEATIFWALGQLIPILMNQPERNNDRDHKIRVVFGFPSPPDLHEKFEKRFGVKLTHSYGLTEGGLPIATLYDEHRLGTVGKVFEDLYDVSIVDENDEELPPEEH